MNNDTVFEYLYRVRILLNVNADSGDREHLDYLRIGFS